MQIPEIISTHSNEFMQWAKFWHSDHEDCAVSAALRNKASLSELFEAVVEVEGNEWQESFEVFIGNH